MGWGLGWGGGVSWGMGGLGWGNLRKESECDIHIVHCRELLSEIVR
jgi:hypothetical protein